jgi:hypothetical protein
MEPKEMQLKDSEYWKSYFLEFLMVFLSECFRNLWAYQVKAKLSKKARISNSKEMNWYFYFIPSNPKEDPIPLFGGMTCFTNL